jgi:hypothetical protein
MLTWDKHSREDTLPLHPDLVELLRGWLPQLTDTEPLFPKLARRKTWIMIKHDLEKEGIPYETKDGFADFHASGSHTYITELLRNGVTLPEAKELARHSDIKTTLKYTHIGLADRAQAVRVLVKPVKEGNRQQNAAGVVPKAQPEATGLDSPAVQDPAASAANALHFWEALWSKTSYKQESRGNRTQVELTWDAVQDWTLDFAILQTAD